MKNVGLAIVVVLIVLILSTQEAHASVPSAVANFLGVPGAIPQIVLFVTKVLVALIQTLVGYLIKAAALLIGVALWFNSSLAGNLGGNIFVLTGWGIFRNLANLGFVFGIIVIAIATILRLQSYQARSILWKLIVAALLVNFSLVIVGSLINVADIFSNFFNQSISGQRGVSNDWNVLVNKVVDSSKYNIVAFQNASQSTELSQNQIDAMGKDALDIISLVIKVVIGVGVTLVLLAVATLLFLRYFYLTFLIIVSPIVLLLWIFPNTKEYWTKWWSALIKWLLFAPVNLLFIWLALSVGDSMNTLVNNASQMLGQNTSLAGIALKDLVATLTSAFLLIAGLKISLSMGLAGSEIVMKGATRVGGWAKTKAQRGAIRAGRRTLEGRPGSAIQRGITRFGGTTVGKMLGVGYLAQATKGAQATLTKKSQAYIEEQREKFDKMKNSDDIVGLMSAMTPEQRAAAMEVLAVRGDMGKVKSVDNVMGAVDSLRRVGRVKEAIDIEKKFGMNAEMMRSLKAGGGRIEVKREGKKKEMDFQELAREFYGGFSETDWKNEAKAQGNTLYDSKKREILGLTEAQSDMYRSAHTDNVIHHAGNAIGVTASQLKGDQLRNYYEQVIRTATGGAALGTVEEEYEEEVERERPAGIGATVKEKVKETKTRTIDAQKAVNDALNEGNIDGAISIMGKSQDENVKRAAAKLKKRMGSFVAMMSSSEESGGEKAAEPKASAEKKSS